MFEENWPSLSSLTVMNSWDKGKTQPTTSWGNLKKTSRRITNLFNHYFRYVHHFFCITGKQIDLVNISTEFDVAYPIVRNIRKIHGRFLTFV